MSATNVERVGRVRVSGARVVLSVGLLVAGVGVLTEFLGGAPGFPTVPPGPIILGAAAVAVLLPWRWTPLVGLVAALFVTVGGILATISNGAMVNMLSAPADLGPFVGAILQTVGLLVALGAGAAWIASVARR